MKIAIIGSGISGLTAAHLLHRDFDITLFEANDYIGGHTHTVEVEREHGVYQIDTGFIVFNETTYPNFTKIIKKLGVASQPTTMSFSVKSEKNALEYNAYSLNTIFAQRKNMLNPSFYRMIFDMLRFRRQFDDLLVREKENVSLLPYLEQAGYSNFFIDYFIIPLASSLWSAPPHKIRDFPLITFVRFFKNHLFFNIKKQLPWRVIKGGSQRYIDKLIVPFKHAIRTECPVSSITRHADHVLVTSKAGTHPVYLPTSPRTQQRHTEISGINRTHYCGAYWGYGFHEDGVNSALEVCSFFGKTL